MWFKQLQIFKFPKNTNLSIENLLENLLEKLALLSFKPCLPSMPYATGWVSPLGYEEETAPLLRSIHGKIILCLQIEEKILPASVVRHELMQKVKKIEVNEDRRVRGREKLTLKDELTLSLLPRAFSRYSKVYGFLDLATSRLFLGTVNPKNTKLFISMLKKVLNEEFTPLAQQKLAPLITQWIKHQSYPSSFAIEKACVLQDPRLERRVIRCQEQDLFADSIQTLIKEGCQVKQLALNWQDRVAFVLGEDFSFKGIRYQDQVVLQTKEMDPESKDQQFDADFYIMAHEIENLLQDLLSVLESGDREAA